MDRCLIGLSRFVVWGLKRIRRHFSNEKGHSEITRTSVRVWGRRTEAVESLRAAPSPSGGEMLPVDPAYADAGPSSVCLCSPHSHKTKPLWETPFQEAAYFKTVRNELVPATAKAPIKPLPVPVKLSPTQVDLRWVSVFLSYFLSPSYLLNDLPGRDVGKTPSRRRK
jgi:hypothetical protein